jgi:ABC-type sulfate transport system permease subunit
MRRVKPFSFGDSILFNHLFQAKKLGCVMGLLWLPILMTLGLFPFVFEYYTVKTLYAKFGLNKLIDWLFFLTPIITGVFTILIYNQGRKTIARMKKEES